ncbi:uncharacterized protein P884DRAFT_261004 [Thermothelomyces heterothallicus CBS 202.75]|uniref:uncharacterized protein n=1 Tax=Thermothelomyces heterothallicus CBS 202.75 TaxID=1149848 RepID=UPI003743644B
MFCILLCIWRGIFVLGGVGVFGVRYSRFFIFYFYFLFFGYVDMSIWREALVAQNQGIPSVESSFSVSMALCYSWSLLIVDYDTAELCFSACCFADLFKFEYFGVSFEV